MVGTIESPKTNNKRGEQNGLKMLSEGLVSLASRLHYFPPLFAYTGHTSGNYKTTENACRSTNWTQSFA